MSDLGERYARDEVAETVAVLTALMAAKDALASVVRAADLCVASLRGGNKVLFAGNGGSAADAQHLAAELIGRLNFERPGLPAVALTADSAILTALGNDYGYEEVFRRQVEAIGAKGDVLVAISTSGRSKNVLKALEAARGKAMITIAMTGAHAGAMSALSDVCLSIPSAQTQKIQEGHIVVGHILCGLIERLMFPRT